jgi:hypothetical protein
VNVAHARLRRLGRGSLVNTAQRNPAGVALTAL